MQFEIGRKHSHIKEGEMDIKKKYAYLPIIVKDAVSPKEFLIWLEPYFIVRSDFVFKSKTYLRNEKYKAYPRRLPLTKRKADNEDA